MPTLKLGWIKGKHKKRKTIKINKAIDEERAKGGRSKGDAGRGEGRKQPNQFASRVQYTVVSIGVLFSGHKSLKSGIEKVQWIEVGRGTAAMANAEHPLPCTPFCLPASCCSLPRRKEHEERTNGVVKQAESTVGPSRPGRGSCRVQGLCTAVCLHVQKLCVRVCVGRPHSCCCCCC